jgi:cellulose synthase (UDP-forming)
VLVLIAAVFTLLGYSLAGALGWVPWRATAGATVASAVWLLLAGIGLVLGVVRVMAPAYATSRRNAHRVAVRAKVRLDGVDGELVDLSVGGAAVRFASGTAPTTPEVELHRPGAEPAPMTVVRSLRDPSSSDQIVALRAADGDWPTLRVISMWLFHTPREALDGVPPGVPAVAATRRRYRSRALGALMTEGRR